MKLLLQSAMIFFGTLMTAAVVALGEPAQADVALAEAAAAAPSPALELELELELASSQSGGADLR